MAVVVVVGGGEGTEGWRVASSCSVSASKFGNTLISDPMSIGTDEKQRLWERELGFAFPPLNLINRVLRKVQHKKANQSIIDTQT